MKEFSNWLLQELNNRGWNTAELTRRTNSSSGTLSNILNGNRNPGPEICREIAHALNLPEEFVFRKAGLLSPAAPKKNELTGTDWQIFNELQTVEDDFKKAVLKTIKTWKLLYEELKNNELH